MTPSEFDSVSCPLSGVHLVEAAAGTGKTYNIENLALRLILEEGIPVESLVVVTYTKAAAAELKTRLRRILRKAADALAFGIADERVRPVLERLTDHEEAARRLSAALADFDNAPISTIHGFAGRILRENAFESGVLFQCELESAGSKLLAAAARDLYRQAFYAPADGAFRIPLAEYLELTPEAIEGCAGRLAGHENLRWRTSAAIAPDETAEALLAELEAAAEHLRELFPPEGEIVPPELGKCLNKPFRPADLEAFAARFGEGTWTPELFASLEEFTAEGVRGALGKRYQTPEKFAAVEALLATPLFVELDQLARGVPKFRELFLIRNAEATLRRFEEEKRRENLLTFDDMLRRVRDALRLPGGALANELRKHFRAGVVDEFQDTDPVQYEIFRRIFSEGGLPLFLVGDPRQAIYAFRGGDLATYLAARSEVDHIHTLGTNYRSAAGLVEAVSTIFGGGHPSPFAFPRGVLALPPLVAAGSIPPLHPDRSALEVIDSSAITSGSFADFAAWKALEFLEDETPLLPESSGGLRRVTPGDIAILVRNRFDAADIRKALARVGIPSVFSKSVSVYRSEEAVELRIFLEGVLECHRSGMVTDALATPLGGVTLEEQVRLQTPEGEADRLAWFDCFRRLAECWEEDSFMAMFREMLARFEVPVRLMGLPGGERKLTNLYHLADLLEEESFRRRPTPRGLVNFLADRIRRGGEEGMEAEEQQLETDRLAVRIMTHHGSKGLEFPIVLLPTLWLAMATRGDSLYHTPGGELEYDLSGSAEGAARGANESMQELLRIAYVALTRAKHHAVLFLGRTGSRTLPASPLDWLFKLREAGEEAAEDVLAALRERKEIPCAIPAEMRAEEPVPESCWYVPPDAPCDELKVPEWRGSVDPNWYYASYSRLKPSGEEAVSALEEAAADFDDVAMGEEEEVVADGPFRLPGGKGVGNALHKALELADFAANRESLERLLAPLLLYHGVSGEETPGLAAELLWNTLHAPLRDGERREFRLCEVSPERRLNEFEFTYAFRKGLTARDLKGVLRPFIRERFGREEFPDWRFVMSGGFLNGLIDLVFEHGGKTYLVDWKSNRIGGKLRNFSGRPLAEEMWLGCYWFQYLLYIVGWLRYLESRGGDGEREYRERFGGVFYLFLRGVSPEAPGRGIYFDKPEWDLIHSLKKILS